MTALVIRSFPLSDPNANICVSGGCIVNMALAPLADMGIGCQITAMRGQLGEPFWTGHPSEYFALCSKP